MKQTIPAIVMKDRKPGDILWRRLFEARVTEKKATVILEHHREEDGDIIKIDISFDRLFPDLPPNADIETGLKVYKSTIAYKDDQLRSEWPFTAVIKESEIPGRFHLDRVARIRELWRDIEKKTSSDKIAERLLQVRVVGGRREGFLAKIEGNISCHIPSAEILSYPKFRDSRGMWA